MSVTRACFWHCHSGRAPSLTPPLAVGSTGTTKKLWGLHGSYSYIVNTSSCNPCSENNQIFKLSNCFSCLVTSSQTMSAFENVSGLPSNLLCESLCVFLFPSVDHFFFKSQRTGPPAAMIWNCLMAIFLKKKIIKQLLLVKENPETKP